MQKPEFLITYLSCSIKQFYTGAQVGSSNFNISYENVTPLHLAARRLAVDIVRLLYHYPGIETDSVATFRVLSLYL